jgi:hypothetical protein
MIFRELPVILKEVRISKNMIISGCNSKKKSDFQNLKVATLPIKKTTHLIL